MQGRRAGVGAEESQEVRSTEWAQRTSQATSQGGSPLNWLAEHHMATGPTVPEAPHPHSPVSPIPAFTLKGFLHLYPASRGHCQGWNCMEQPGQGLFSLWCCSGRVTTRRNHLPQRLYPQEALGSLKLAGKVSVRGDGSVSEELGKQKSAQEGKLGQCPSWQWQIWTQLENHAVNSHGLALVTTLRTPAPHGLCMAFHTIRSVSPSPASHEVHSALPAVSPPLPSSPWARPCALGDEPHWMREAIQL